MPHSGHRCSVPPGQHRTFAAGCRSLVGSATPGLFFGRSEGPTRAGVDADPSNRGDNRRRRAVDRPENCDVEAQRRMGRPVGLQHGAGHGTPDGWTFGPSPRGFLCERPLQTDLALVATAETYCGAEGRVHPTNNDKRGGPTGVSAWSARDGKSHHCSAASSPATIKGAHIIG